jgi:hypothetical protein
MAEAENGSSSYRRAASRIVGLGTLDAYYQNWIPRSQELRELHYVAGTIEGAAVASDHWSELRVAADRLRAAIYRKRAA